MALEIEHKYLVINDGYRNLATKSLNITQGYLSRDKACTIRVRITDDNAFITIKGENSGDTRAEFEYALPIDDARCMLALCQHGFISKTRYLVHYKGNLWEVDEFHGKLEGMVIAEIEIPESGYKYDTPPFVGEDVTDNPYYYNSNLSAL